jgi:YHS domain-containing protein
MNRCKLTIVALFVVAGATQFCPIATGADDVNVMCPVLQDRRATADYAVTYKGEEVRFCCSECVIEFNRNPEIYESVLPQLQNIPLRAKVQLFFSDYGGLVTAGLLLAILIGLRVYRHRHPVVTDSTPSTFGRLVQKKISPAIPLFLLAGYLGFEVYSLQAQLHETQLEDEIHFATFYDFGYPPSPKRPATEPQLKASYYRGNDERSPKLFNDGNYRTATFHVSLCDGDGHEVGTGTDLSGRSVFLKFEIDRPPFTPDFLYDEQMMNTMFLTAQCDRFLGASGPISDAVSLTETETMQHWEALFPIRGADACSECKDCRGTVYVCEKYFYDSQLKFLGKRRGGSRFHYGIRYDLKTRGGFLVDESDMYMGALYRTRKLPTWRVPMTQWFSHEPIPVLPSENVQDPELLGIPEHLAKRDVAANHGETSQR